MDSDEGGIHGGNGTIVKWEVVGMNPASSAAVVRTVSNLIIRQGPAAEDFWKKSSGSAARGRQWIQIRRVQVPQTHVGRTSGQRSYKVGKHSATLCGSSVAGGRTGGGSKFANTRMM